MSKNEDKNQKNLALVIIIGILILGIYKIFFENKLFNEEKIDTETILVVDNVNRFFTVSSCVAKYFSYLSSRDTEDLLTLLSNDYKTTNSINSENIYNFIGTLNANETFSARKMFQQRLSKSIYKYYIHGYIEEDTINAVSSKQNYYIIVILDESNMTFAIEPYDGKLFK